MNCERCPIQEECEATKEKIVNMCVADMRVIMGEMIDYCPLEIFMMNEIETRAEILLDPPLLRGD